MPSEIIFERIGHEKAIGLVTLNRPKSLNALSHQMIRDLYHTLNLWSNDSSLHFVIVHSNQERAFCAGGDVRSLYDLYQQKQTGIEQFFWDEYNLDRLISRYPKPYLSFWKGIVMGGGIGISVHGRYRIAATPLSFAMPETAIGFIPDIGASYFLSHLPDHWGLYLALTGTRLNADETFLLGLATHRIDQLEPLFQSIVDLQNPTDLPKILEKYAINPIQNSLQDKTNWIKSIFSANSLEEIVERLQADPSPWSQETRDLLATRSPLSLKITYDLLKKGQHLSLDECLKMEYRVASHCVAGSDFYEGVRALMVDKDNQPHWKYAKIQEISQSIVDSYFFPINKELEFKEVAK